MKRFFVGLLIAYASVGLNVSYAQTPGNEDGVEKKYSAVGPIEQLEVEGQTYFEKVGALFESGSKPDPKKLSDTLWAGRCFRENKPNDPVAGVLAFLHSSNFLVSEMSNHNADHPEYVDKRYAQYQSIVSNLQKITEGYAALVGTDETGDVHEFDEKDFFYIGRNLLKEVPLRQVSEEDTSLNITWANGATVKMRESNGFVVAEGETTSKTKCYFFRHDKAPKP